MFTKNLILLDRDQRLTEGDVFIGYHDDTAASLVLQVTKAEEAGRGEGEDEEIEEEWSEKVCYGTVAFRGPVHADWSMQ